jgi:hypothetical protein
MASVRKERQIEAPAADAWDAVRDFGALHTRLVPGFVTDTKLDGDARLVTFANGSTAREILVDRDDAARRLVYAVVGGQVTQHSASVEVVAEGETRCRFVWTADFLPNGLRDYIEGQMELGIGVIKQTLDGKG